MADVKLFKKEVAYTSKKDGKEKKTTNFYLQCGDRLIPIAAKYFEDKESGKDNSFAARVSVMSAFADVLPDKA